MESNTKYEEDEEDIDNVDKFSEEIYESKEEPKIVKKYMEKKADVSNVLIAINGQDVDEINDKIIEYLEECSDGSFKCSLCGKTSGVNMHKSIQKQMIKRHIETHMDGLTYTCPFCQKTCRSSNGLIKHKARYHR